MKHPGLTSESGHGPNAIQVRSDCIQKQSDLIQIQRDVIQIGFGSIQVQSDCIKKNDFIQAACDPTRSLT